VNPRNLICLVVDGLHAGMVGAYGNSWIRTEQIDRLASESFVFDQAMIESPKLDAIYDGFWHGRSQSHHMLPRRASLAAILKQTGTQTALITDAAEVTAAPGAIDFGQTLLVECPPCQGLAGDPLDTGIARFFDTLTNRLPDLREPFLLWGHSQAMYGPWDAPYEFRERFADEEDPPPPEFFDVPNRRLRADHDPDELTGIVQACAGQVTLVDRGIEALRSRLAAAKLLDSTLLVVLSSRGFPLGEHLRVGACDNALYNELTQMIWLMRFPDGLGRLDRSHALVTPSDLPGTLLDWLGLDRETLASGATSLLPVLRGEPYLSRDRIYLESQDDRALRTAAWLLRQPTVGSAELYAKSSDRWEVNDVANRCPDIVSDMQDAMAQTTKAGKDGALPPLAPALMAEVD
jgi:arylsulfatase A-like enzyme